MIMLNIQYKMSKNVFEETKKENHIYIGSL